MTGSEVIKYYNKLKQERWNFDERWERMAPFISPSRVGITGAFSPGEKQSSGVFDSTCMLASELMAMFIAGHIINPSQRWFSFAMKDPLLAQVDSIREWLEDCRDRTLARLANSMFYAEAPESLIDYGGFGTGFLMTEEMSPAPNLRSRKGFRGFYFHAERTGRFVISEGSNGMVDTAMREFSLPCRVICDRWDHSKLPQSVMECYHTGDRERSFKIIHAIIPRPSYEQTVGSKGMPWASYWVEYDSAQILHESGYRTFPASVPRYHRTPGEVYGRGRGDLAFPDTWTLNMAKKMGLEDWALKIRPPILLANDSVMGTIRLVPAGPTPINTHGRPVRDVIMPYETGSRPEVSQIKEEELRKTIREIFYVDTIRELLEMHKSEQTAYEYSKRLNLLFRLMGPVYGRLEWEFLNQTMDTCFDIMYNAGDYAPPPPEIFRGDGIVDIRFENPIALAQKSGDAEALTFALGDLSPLAQLPQFQQMLDVLDGDKAAEGILNTRGVPAKWLRNKDEILALRAERQRQNEEQQAMEQMGSAAQAAGQAAPMVKALSQAQQTGGMI